MTLQNKQLLPEKAVQLDLDEIYLGNLNTVDADLALPEAGKRGTVFSWESRETLFISHRGKVTRPTHGVGNRVVPLIVTATLDGFSAERVFDATVLEQPRQARIVRLLPVRMRQKIGDEVDLPPVVIAVDDTGIMTTLPVVWEKTAVPVRSGAFRVVGMVEETNLPAGAEVEALPTLPADAEAFTGDRASAMPPGAVRLLSGTRFHDAQERMIAFLLSVDDDRMLYNFRAAAGLNTKDAEPMTGWDAPECNLRGHTTGHYLSGLALAWSASGRRELRNKIEYMVEALAECGKALERRGCRPGFLSAYSEEQFDLLEEFTPYPAIWAPYYTLDKILSGLLDCHSLAGCAQALTLASGIGDWVHARLGELSRSKLDRMWSMYIAGEFGGMISALIRLHRVSGKREHAQAAFFFRNEKLFYPMQENVDTLKDMHANQHIPQAIGALDFYRAGGSSRYRRIAENFWSMAVTAHAFSIGGVGETEMFHEPNCVARYLTDKAAESCASYNLLRLTSELFALEPDAGRFEYYENALYNHVLASASHAEDGGTTYFMPLLAGGKKEYNTDENTCCHGTGLESRFRYVRDIYFRGQSELFVNLYIPSTLATEDGWHMELSEAGDDPGRFRLAIDGAAGLRTIALRIPRWAEEGYAVAVNSDRVDNAADTDGYVRIARSWKNGDAVDVYLPYRFRKLPAPDDSCFVSIAHGPYILAALSDSEEYLPCPDTGALDGNGKNTADGVAYVPIADVDKERYHIYFHERQ